MPGMGLNFSSNDQKAWTQVSLWVKFAELPPNDTVLFEALNTGTLDLQIILQTGGSVVASWEYRGGLITVQCTSTTLLDAGKWYWISVIVGGNVDFHGIIIGQVIGPAGATDGPQTAHMTLGTPHASETLTCDVGWGVHLSGSLDDFPNSSGWEMKGLMIVTDIGSSSFASGVGTAAAPTADPAVTTFMRGLYLCNQALGPAGTIVDSTGYHNDMIAGPHNATIVADGPY